MNNIPTIRPFHFAPLTPTLDPIPDDYEDNSGSNSEEEQQDMLAEPFSMLKLDSNDETFSHKLSPNPQLQMRQPRPRRSAPNAMLNQTRPLTPPKSVSSIDSYQYQQNLGHTSPQLHTSTSNPLLNAPPMIRAHSSPVIYSSPAQLQPSRSRSPLRSPKRVRSPLRHFSADDTYHFIGSTSTLTNMSPEISSISEDAELEITPRSRHHPHSLSVSSAPSPYPSLTFPRPLRRRAHSPHRSISSSRASSVPASPLLLPGRFSESFPADLPYSRGTLSLSSSMPSTPTSARSRSPSISSLETIPDTPDAENLAVEEDRRDRDERKRMWDLYGAPAQAQAAATNSSGVRGGGFGGRDKRKRWSVCGAEKRSDLNLETIWED